MMRPLNVWGLCAWRDAVGTAAAVLGLGRGIQAYLAPGKSLPVAGATEGEAVSTSRKRREMGRNAWVAVTSGRRHATIATLLK